MREETTTLYLVVPCYNEEEVLWKTSEVLKEKICRLMEKGSISAKSKILFVNDGSKDKTWEIIYELTQTDRIYAGLSFPEILGIRVQFWQE